MKCRWYQFWINCWLDDDRTLSESARNHVRSCARCEQFLHEQASLSRQLSRQDEPGPQPSPFLKQRILNGITSKEFDLAEGGNLRWLGAGALASLVFALAMLLSGGNRLEEATTKSVADLTVSEWVALTAKMPTGESLLRVANGLDQPLHQELDFVIKDARTVLDSLTREFVPSRLLASSD